MRKSTSAHRRPLGGRGLPAVWPVAEVPAGFAGRGAVAPVLEVMAAELAPPGAAFFAVDGDGELEACVVRDARAAPADLADEVRRCIATLDDGEGGQRTLVPIRDDGRLIAGVALWQPPDGARWTRAQLRLLAALQPLVEMAYLSARAAAARLEAQLPADLTERQRQVAHLLVAGATNPEVARALFISPDTAKSHTRTVLGKLGVASRRELVLRFGEATSAPPPSAGGDRASLRLDGDAAPRPLLGAALEWGAERIDAAIGGCAVFSARLELVAEAWGSVRAGRRGPDARVAGQVHRRVLSPAQPSEIVRYLDADRARSPVVQLNVSGPAPGDDGLGELVAGVGLTPPLLTVLRRQGRVAGVIWLCRDAAAGRDQRDGARALRGVHRLLELTHVTGATDRADVAAAGELAALGLTPREQAVARLALAGESNATIASRLSISESTVKKHMSRVLAKAGVRSRTQLIAQLSEGVDDG